MATLDYSWWYDDNELSQPSDESETSSDEDMDPKPALPVAPNSEVKRIKATRPSTQQATKQSRDRIASKSLPYLKSPRTTTYSLSSLHDMMTSGIIDLDPEYQRAVVWSTHKQESLIDSFYHNFYVPPIIFATSTREEDGAEIRTCLDGKQRLTSMRLFMDGELPHKDSLTGKRSWFSNAKGSKRRLITPQWQSKFRNTQIACVEYDGITEEQQREIFQRVQMGVTLTPAERLQSANGPIADLIREVRVRINSIEGLEGYLDWGKAPGKDFQALAEIAYLITHTKTVPTIARLEAFLDNKTHPVPAAKRRHEFLVILQPTMPNVMDIFSRIVQHPELGEPLRKSLSRLEFVMSAYLVFQHRKKLSDSQLSHSIARMRREVQRSFKDMKFDGAKCKYLLNFIHKTVPELISNANDCGDVPAIQVLCQSVESRSGERFKDAKVEDTSGKPATKRKRKELEGEKNTADSDDEALLVKVKRKRSGSVSNTGSGKKTIDTDPTTPRAPTSLNTSRSQAAVSKAKTTIKRTPVKEQTTSSQMNDVKNPMQGRITTVNKSERLQIATPSVKPPPSTRTVPGPSQQVISSLGAHIWEPVPLGRRAGAARKAALNQPHLTTPVTPAKTAPSITISQRARQRSMNFGNNSSVVQQSTLSPSTATGMTSGSVLPADAPSTSVRSQSARIRAGTGSPDRLAVFRSAKAAAPSITGSSPFRPT